MEHTQLKRLIIQLKEITNTTLERLPSLNDADFIAFVNERQKIVGDMEVFRPIVTEEDKEEIRLVLNSDPAILKRMNEIKDEAGHWLEKQNSIRNQQNAYMQGYSMDSLFIDYRK